MEVDTLQPLGQLGVWLGSKAPALFTPGFDSQRELSPVIIDSETMNQTVRVIVTAEEEMNRIYVDVQLDTTSLVSASILASSMAPKDGWIYDDRTGLAWTIASPEPGQSYEFSVTLQLKNPLHPEKLLYKPRVVVRCEQSSFSEDLAQVGQRWIIVRCLRSMSTVGVSNVGRQPPGGLRREVSVW